LNDCNIEENMTMLGESSCTHLCIYFKKKSVIFLAYLSRKPTITNWIEKIVTKTYINLNIDSIMLWLPNEGVSVIKNKNKRVDD